MPQVNRDVLVDKLCERLAVETGGVDIYQSIIAKMPDETIAARLKHFMQEEAKHRDMIAAYLDKLGVAPTETASARLARLEAQAFVKLVDEASTPAQLLNILLTFELMDENAWEMLINFGRDTGDEEIVRTFNMALKEEKEHLRGVRGMMAAMTRQMMMAVDEAPKH
jgi:rubrerythrin